MRSPLIKTLSEQERKDLLLGYFPRFIWRAVLFYDHAPVMELLMDATEAKTKLPLFGLVMYSKAFSTNLLLSVSDESARNYLQKQGLLEFF